MRTLTKGRAIGWVLEVAQLLERLPTFIGGVR